jgi:hypothetical protein
MAETIVSGFWIGVAIYAALGIGFSIPFVRHWSGKMDPSAKAGSRGFRLAILPATVALWPLLLRKVSRHSEPPLDIEWPIPPAAQRRLHGLAFILIALFVPLIGIAALRFRVEPSSSRIPLNEAANSTEAAIASLAATKLPIRAETTLVAGRRTLRLVISRPLADPVVAVYWSPAAIADGISPEAVFLGTIWGPARLAFPLPSGAEGGVLTFIALAGEQRVLEILPLP